MSVASKNLFAILGNDEEPEIPAPVKTVDKTSTHTAKRNTDGVAPAKGPAPTGGRRGGAVSGNEAAFRDRNAGRETNRGKSTDEVRGGRRGGRGGRGKGEGDRHPHKAAPHGGSEKTAEQAWGANKGESELADTEAAQDDAKKELTEAEKEAAAAAEAEAALQAEEDKKQSYDQYFAANPVKEELIAKPKRTVDASAFQGAKALNKGELEDLFPSKNVKKERTREKKQKQVVELENRFIEPERPSGGRGGRGGPRGGRPEGARGGRGEGAPRRGGDGPRGGRGGPRGGAPRGGAAPRKENAPINTSDESAFPSLGA
ncbi:hypothetical protein QBC35DRAFT_495649 [Podospora australis]|uniref:STM1-like N-terminal domain-containing protein n=1 Tax=Podospora australis TaxID=1536484 RepID=A0AAN6WV25_9PEZI|nr:hypothetical protein QBC35DRAFT_495649 [Podospora australis]